MVGQEQNKFQIYILQDIFMKNWKNLQEIML